MDGIKPKHDPLGDNMISQVPTEPLWTVNDVAKYLQLRPSTVRDMARKKDLPGIKVGERVWRFRSRDIKSWLEDQ